MKDLKCLFGYLGPYRRDMLMAALLIIVETVFELVIPVFMADLIDVGVTNGDISYIVSKLSFGQLSLCFFGNRL